jgi:hypothetical protein
MYLEFIDLNLEADEWLYERYIEIRKLVKACLFTKSKSDTIATVLGSD